MEKNKSFGHAVRDGGARYYHAAGENGYGLNSDMPFSMSSDGTYNPMAQYAEPINYDGINYDNERMLGHRGATPIGTQSEVGKDAIDYDATVDSKPKGYRPTNVAGSRPNEHGD